MTTERRNFYVGHRNFEFRQLSDGRALFAIDLPGLDRTVVGAFNPAELRNIAKHFSMMADVLDPVGDAPMLGGDKRIK